MAMRCECGREVSEDFTCPKCHKTGFKLTVDIPCEVETDQDEWKQTEKELVAIVGRDFDGQKGWCHGSFDLDASLACGDLKDVARHYSWDYMPFGEAVEVRKKIESRGWIATVSEY